MYRPIYIMINTMFKKNKLLACAILLGISSAQAQIEDPVKWTYSAKSLVDKSYELHISAQIEANWHMYSQ
ncbi:MAG: hypothetical protein ABIT58_04950 [Ferruginibacter sp.]